MTSNQKQAFWLNHIGEWQASELTQQAYCQAHDLKPHQFTYWKHKLSPANKKDDLQDGSGFIPVQVLAPTKTSPLSLVLPNGIRVEGVAPDNLGICRQIMESFR